MNAIIVMVSYSDLIVCYVSVGYPNRMSLICGDALTELNKIESETIDCCITSPPYWALRDYKTEGQLGLEPTFAEYINKLVTIFDEVKRVLKKTGSCWVVIGDTYSNWLSHYERYGGGYKNNSERTKQRYIPQERVQQKSLCMIPERFAIAMVDHGWILRNKIVWFKPNCMPSSAKDRFTVDWEYVYFFTKSRRYFFETQYEPILDESIKRYDRRTSDKTKCFLNPPNQNAHSFTHENGIMKLKESAALGRIKRCVWKISTRPYSGAHFAVFPPQLIEPMIKAGCPVEGIVLDPFMGAGTTGLVALLNARNFKGIDINPEYIQMASKRLEPWIKQERLLIT